MESTQWLEITSEPMYTVATSGFACNETDNNSVSSNCSTVEAEEEGETTQRLLLVIPLVLLAFITIGGNVIVMICTRIEKRLRNVSTLYVFSLAVADCIVGFAVMGPMTVYTVNGMWPLGVNLCTTWMVFDFCCCTVSMLHLCLVAHDRYVALVHPMQYKSSRTSKDALVRIAVAWMLGALAWIPCIVLIRYDLDKDNVDPLDCFFTYNKWFVLIQSLAVYYAPIVVMCFFYVACLHVLRMRYKKTAALGLGQGAVFIPGDASLTNTTSGLNTTQVLDVNALNGKKSHLNFSSFSFFSLVLKFVLGLYLLLLHPFFSESPSF